MRQNNNDELSLACELKCLSLREEIYDPHDQYVDDSLSDIGYCYEKLNEMELALEYYQRAINVYRKGMIRKS